MGFRRFMGPTFFSRLIGSSYVVVRALLCRSTVAQLSILLLGVQKPMLVGVIHPVVGAATTLQLLVPWLCCKQ